MPRQKTTKFTGLAGADTKAPRGDRKIGKSKDPDYRQLYAWVRRDTYTAMQHKLYDDGREISELIQDMLEAWIAEKPRKPARSSGRLTR